MRKIKFIVLVLVGLSVSTQAFAVVEKSGKIVSKSIEMEAVELNVFADEGIDLNEAVYPYFEDKDIKVSNRELNKVLNGAYSSDAYLKE